MDDTRQYPDISDLIARKKRGREEIKRLTFGEKIERMEALRRRLAPLKEARIDMKLRDLIKMTGPNDGSRTLLESCLNPAMEEVLRDWAAAQVPAGLLIGGLAVSFYVKPYYTQKVDILFLDPGDVPEAIPGFTRIRADVFQHIPTRVEVDLFTPARINVDPAIVRKVFDTAIESDGILIASPTGIAALKLRRGSFHDQADIQELLQSKEIDLTRWGLSDAEMALFERIRAEPYKSQPRD